MGKQIPNRPSRLSQVFRKFDPPLYFITICTYDRKRILANDVLHLHFIEFMSGMGRKGIACGEYVIMPDHIHLFLRIDPHRYQLGRTVGFIKKSLSKPLSGLGVDRPHWQPGFFDHVVRSDQSYAEKWEYVRLNPVRAGLVADSIDWKFQGTIVPIRY